MQKKILWSILALFVIVLVGVFAYSTYTHKEGTVIDRRLTMEQRKVYEDRITESKASLASLDKTLKNYAMQAAVWHLNIGQLYFGLGRLSHALEEFEKALVLDKTNQNIYVSKSLVLTEMKDFAAAKTTLEEVLNIEPRVADVWLRLIEVHKTMNDSVSGIEAVYSSALEKTKRHVDILANKAQYEEMLGNKKEALELWKEALVEYPNNSGYTLEVERLSK